jgi:hypothetical protein
MGLIKTCNKCGSFYVLGHPGGCETCAKRKQRNERRKQKRTIDKDTRNDDE